MATKDFAPVPPLPAFPSEVVLRELGGGLVLRRATPADVDVLEAFNTVAHADPPDFTPVPWVGRWTRDLASGKHPRARVGDFTIVEDVPRKRLVSTLCLLDHRFRFEEIGFEAGQIELVATRPEYRARGLVAAQVDAVHGWSAERGQALTVIDGIPWFYRQFGYEYALENRGFRAAPLAYLRRGEAHRRLRARPAEVGDAAWLARLFARMDARSLVCCPRDEAFLRYEIAGRDPWNAMRREFHVVEDAARRAVGAFAVLQVLAPKGWLQVFFAELDEALPWSDAATDLLHLVAEAGEGVAKRCGEALDGAAFVLPSGHPLFAVAPERFPDERPHYAWYVRCPDLAGFLRRVAPVLERRLAASAFAGHTGTLAVNTYREGHRLVFERGRLAAVESWRPDTEHPGDLGLPGRSFLQLVLGFRRLGELERCLPDAVCWRDAARPLSEALFPRRPSWLWCTA